MKNKFKKIEFVNLPAEEDVAEMKNYIDTYEEEQGIKDKLISKTVIILILGSFSLITFAAILLGVLTNLDHFILIMLYVAAAIPTVYTLAQISDNYGFIFPFFEKKHLPWKTNPNDYLEIKQRYELYQFISTLPVKILEEHYVLMENYHNELNDLEINYSGADEAGVVSDKNIRLINVSRERNIEIKKAILDVKNMKLTIPYYEEV